MKHLHPRPSPIAASLYTLRDLNADVIILHGPHGCCFRTSRLLETDGVRVVTTAMSENDFIFGASEKLEETLKKVDSLFSPKLVGVVGTCASMIIGEDMKEAVENANIPAQVLIVESHGGLSEGDNTEGAISVLNSAEREGVISGEEAERQTRMLKMATKIEKGSKRVSNFLRFVWYFNDASQDYASIQDCPSFFDSVGPYGLRCSIGYAHL